MDLSNTKKVAICADLHCGVRQDSSVFHKITLDWAKWFKKDLEDKDIDTILFLGDFFHDRSDISVKTLQVAADVLRLWKDFKIVVIIGNHDISQKHTTDISSVSIFSGWNNIKVIDNIESLNIGDKKCTFVNWESDLNRVSNCNYLFGHFEISSFKMNNYKICDKGIAPTDLLQKAPIVFSGHFHQENSRKYDTKSITYVGNPFEMDFGDLGSRKGYYILDLVKDKFNFIQNILSPNHLKLKVSEFTGKEDLQNKIVKLIVDQKLTVNEIDKIVFKISNLNPIQLSIEYTYSDKSLVTDLSGCDLSGIDKQKAIEDFINLLTIDCKEPLITLCTEIYNEVV